MTELKIFEFSLELQIQITERTFFIFQRCSGAHRYPRLSGSQLTDQSGLKQCLAFIQTHTHTQNSVVIVVN